MQQYLTLTTKLLREIERESLLIFVSPFFIPKCLDSDHAKLLCIFVEQYYLLKITFTQETPGCMSISFLVVLITFRIEFCAGSVFVLVLLSANCCGSNVVFYLYN